jgi:hypothetical protein
LSDGERVFWASEPWFGTQPGTIERARVSTATDSLPFQERGMPFDAEGAGLLVAATVARWLAIHEREPGNLEVRPGDQQWHVCVDAHGRAVETTRRDPG